MRNNNNTDICAPKLGFFNYGRFVMVQYLYSICIRVADYF